MALLVVPPIVVSAAAECWFYRSGEDALAAGIPAGAKVFDATGQRLEISGADLSVVRGAHSSGDDLVEILTVWLRRCDSRVAGGLAAGHVVAMRRRARRMERPSLSSAEETSSLAGLRAAHAVSAGDQQPT
jgi:hypothetical protein